MNGAYRFGCVTLLGALLLFVLLGIWSELVGPHLWTPVRMPIRLIAGSSASAHFTSDRNDICVIRVGIGQRLPSEQLAQIRPPELAVQVSSDGRPVSFNRYERAQQTGEPVSFDWDNRDDEFSAQAIGDFQAASGQQYTVQVRVNQADLKLQDLDPQLVVTLGAKGSYDDEDVVGAMGFLLFLLLLLVGIPSLVVGIRQSR